jgi:hypothetical protein
VRLPQWPLPGLTQGADEAFLGAFEATLIRANYRLLDQSVIEYAIQAPNEKGLTYVPNFGLFEHMRVYVRGDVQLTRTRRNPRNPLRKQVLSLPGYQRVIVALKFQPGADLGPFAQSDVLYLRLFKDVPHVDLEMHLPEQGTKVKMRMIDKAQIASPLVVGLPTLAFKLLFASLVSPWAIGGVLIAPVSAGLNSFFGFQRAKQRHLSTMIRQLYYLTLASNASVINYLIGSAQEEEFKEAVLAYYFLWQNRDDPEPWDLRGWTPPSRPTSGEDRPGHRLRDRRRPEQADPPGPAPSRPPGPPPRRPHRPRPGHPRRPVGRLLPLHLSPPRPALLLNNFPNAPKRVCPRIGRITIPKQTDATVRP